jgi:hypothetical protein
MSMETKSLRRWCYPLQGAPRETCRPAMNDEFSAWRIANEVVSSLERRRQAIAGDDTAVRAEIEQALAPLRAAYRESALPIGYFAALEGEIREALPVRWQTAAVAFTALERRGFGSWRGGDVYARVVYLFLGLLVGGLCVALPFIPIWEKWFPFALAGAGWWMPDAQAAWHRRRYARELGKMVRAVAVRQPAMEACVSWKELGSPDDDEQRGDPR